jgi:hypothetical protein
MNLRIQYEEDSADRTNFLWKSIILVRINSLSSF